MQHAGEHTLALEVISVSKSFPGVLANDEVTLDVRHGEILGLLGENGAGKSTLMNVVYGLYIPDGGRSASTAKRCASAARSTRSSSGSAWCTSTSCSSPT